MWAAGRSRLFRDGERDNWHIIADNMTPYRFGLLRFVLDTCEYGLVDRFCSLCMLV